MPKSKQDFASIAEHQQEPGIVREFFMFMRENKKWWILPIIVVLALLGIFIAMASGPAAPFIYSLS